MLEKEQFFIIPASIMFHKKLKGDHIRVFSLLYGYLKNREKHKNCWYTNDDLMELTGRSRRQIDILLNHLETENIIRREGHGYRRKFILGSFFNNEKIETDKTLYNPAENVVVDTDLYNCAENVVRQRRKRSTIAQKTKQDSAENVVQNKEENKENNKEQQGQPSATQKKSVMTDQPQPQTFVVFSIPLDQTLLSFRDHLPAHLIPEMPDQAFLEAAQAHIMQTQEKDGIEFEHALNKFKKLMKTILFVKPKNFISQQEKENIKSKNEEHARLQEKASMIKMQADMNEYKTRLKKPLDLVTQKSSIRRLGSLLDGLSEPH